MKEETEPPQMAMAHCPLCGIRLMRGRVVRGGLQQCSRCKKYWLVDMTASKVTVEEAPPYLLR